MAMTPQTINSGTARKKPAKRVGRGNASGKGTYSARGMKGQRARSGGRSKTKRRALKKILQKIPKLRGFTSQHAKKETVTLSMLNTYFQHGDVVTPAALKKIGMVDKPQFGVKIVATGEITKKLTIKDCLLTKQAVDRIEKAGGTIIF